MQIRGGGMDKPSRNLDFERISHAYIFVGEDEKTGKKALEFSKRILCENPKEAPCGRCKACNRIDRGAYTDVFEIFPDGSGIKIDQVRKYILSSAQRPREGEKKIYILHHAHKMTHQAQNALLKTLEEPSEGAITLILTENLMQLLPTVVSRCRVMDFCEAVISSAVKEELRANLAQIFLNIGLSRENPAKALTKELSAAGELLDVLDFAASLYKDVLNVKGGSPVLQNRDVKVEILEASGAISKAGVLYALDLIYNQRKAAMARGNQNLLLYNLIEGLREVTKLDYGSRCPV